MGLKRCREGGEISNITAMADYFMLLSGRQQTETHSASRAFECKTCNRRFESFQALGGHRASHKKPRLIEEDGDSKTRILQLKPKTHECSICGLEFAIGQALGGHMRRHRNMIREDTSTSKKSFVCLDLNLTPYENDLKLQIGKMFPNELAPPLVNYIM